MQAACKLDLFFFQLAYFLLLCSFYVCGPYFELNASVCDVNIQSPSRTGWFSEVRAAADNRGHYEVWAIKKELSRNETELALTWTLSQELRSASSG